MERLTEEQLNALKTWGEGLGQVGQEEMQAAGRAIQLLIQEIEALHIEMWHERIEREPGAHEPPDSEPVSQPVKNLVGALLARARGVTEALRPD